MIPACADSMAPRNELSSQGWATTVVTIGTPLAAEIRRSYFDPGGFESAGIALIVRSETLKGSIVAPNLHLNPVRVALI
jgi:hypothetical protein